MANLSLRHIYKVYSNGCKAVNDFNMEIKDKEFIVFVGPSGCGKSTTLRMIAGLEEISAGELYIDDELVNNMEPKDRDISMVFQNYALYPHMTVYDNMAFGLKLRHVPQEEIHKKVLWAAKVLKLTDYLDRKPRAMSGGQRQRVALGRAILRNPKVFLLDEPLSNLDAKLRTEMRAEITKLHQTLGTTFIYVTHDQVEAMTLGSRVVVMKLGYVQQIDTPQNLYNFPINKFVAGFIGTPQMNFFEAKLLRKGEVVKVFFEGCDASFDVDFNKLIKVRPNYLKGNTKVTVGLRCENISIDPEIVSKSKNIIKAKVSHFEELGSETLVYADLNMEGDGFEETNTRVIIKSYSKGDLRPGDIVNCAFDMSKAHFFDIESEESIAPRIPNVNVFDSNIIDGQIEFLGHKITLPPAMKVMDEKDVEIFIPTDAIDFNGKIPCKVVNVESINGTTLIHVEAKERIFFIVGKHGVNTGDKVNIGIDMKRVSIKKDGKDIVKEVSTRNVFVGTYTNSINNKKATKAIEKYYTTIADDKINKLSKEMNVKIGQLGLNNALLKQYKEELAKDKEIAKVNLMDKLGNDLGKEAKKKAKFDYKADLLTAKEKYLEKVAEFNINQEEAAAKAEKITSEYQELIGKVKEDLTEQISCYEKGLVSEHNKDFILSEVNADKETFEQKMIQLDEKYEKELAAYKEKIASCNSKEEIKAIKCDVASFNDKYRADKDALISEYKTFFININGYYVKSNYNVTKKIVQALGISIFNANYRYEIPIDSMKISSNGIKAEVMSMLDYGDSKYVLADVNKNEIIIKTDKTYKKGEEILVDFSLDDIHVYENKLDIRLY